MGILFLEAERSVRQLAQLVLGGTSIGLLAPRISGAELQAYAALLIQEWWIIPVAVSVLSLLALLAVTSGRRVAPLGHGHVPTGAYLISCPSVAALNMAAIFPLGASPPAWANLVALSTLVCSAWLYFRSTRTEE